MPGPLDALKGIATTTQEPDADDSGAQIEQDVAGYLPPEKGPFKCGNCSYFTNPDRCAIVKGSIAFEGCCNLYEQKN